MSQALHSEGLFLTHITVLGAAAMAWRCRLCLMRPAGHQGRGGRKHGAGTCRHATSAHTSLLTVGSLISQTAREAEGVLGACQ